MHPLIKIPIVEVTMFLPPYGKLSTRAIAVVLFFAQFGPFFALSAGSMRSIDRQEKGGGRE